MASFVDFSLYLSHKILIDGEIKKLYSYTRYNMFN